MPSPKLRQLQDESVAVAAEIETLRSVTPADETEAKGVEERLAAAEKRADEIATEAKRERDLDARIESLRSVRGNDSDAKAVRKAPAIHVRGPAPKHFETADEARVAGEYLRSIARGEKRAWGETSPTYDEAGAELAAPSELYGSVINVLSRQSVGARVALVVNTVAKRMTLPKVSDATASFYSEAAGGSLTDIDTAGVDVDVFGIRSLLAVSNDLIEDSPLDLASVISGAMGNGFATRIDTAWLQGDETADITGLVGTVTNSVPVASAGETTAAELATMVGQVDPLAMNTSWVVSPAGFGALLAAHAATGSVMLSDAMQPTVYGRPVYVTNALPSGTLALYGDFSMATAVAVKASGLRIDALREVRAVNDQVLFVGKQRIGIANHAPQFVSKLIID